MNNQNKEIFGDNTRLLIPLFNFMSISDIEFRNRMIRKFSKHKDVIPLLKRKGLLPEFFATWIILSLD